MDYDTEDLAVREARGVTVVRVKSTRLMSDHDTARMAAEVNGLIDHKGVRKMVVDFKYAEHIGSAALGMLIALQQKMAAVNGRLILSNTGKIDELLRVSKTARLFTIADDLKTAVEQLE